MKKKESRRRGKASGRVACFLCTEPIQKEKRVSGPVNFSGANLAMTVLTKIFKVDVNSALWEQLEEITKSDSALCELCLNKMLSVLHTWNTAKSLATEIVQSYTNAFADAALSIAGEVCLKVNSCSERSEEASSKSLPHQDGENAKSIMRTALGNFSHEFLLPDEKLEHFESRICYPIKNWVEKCRTKELKQIREASVVQMKEIVEVIRRTEELDKEKGSHGSSVRTALLKLVGDADNPLPPVGNGLPYSSTNRALHSDMSNRRVTRSRAVPVNDNNQGSIPKFQSKVPDENLSKQSKTGKSKIKNRQQKNRSSQTIPTEPGKTNFNMETRKLLERKWLDDAREKTPETGSGSRILSSLEAELTGLIQAPIEDISGVSEEYKQILPKNRFLYQTSKSDQPRVQQPSPDIVHSLPTQEICKQKCQEYKKLEKIKIPFKSLATSTRNITTEDNLAHVSSLEDPSMEYAPITSPISTVSAEELLSTDLEASAAPSASVLEEEPFLASNNAENEVITISDDEEIIIKIKNGEEGMQGSNASPELMRKKSASPDGAPTKKLWRKRYFNSIEASKRRMESVGSGDERYELGSCKRKCKSEVRSRRHLLTRAPNTYRYFCTEKGCHKRFIQERLYLAHKRSHDLIRKEKRLKVSRETARLRKLKRKNPMKYPCLYCKFETRSRPNVEKHMEVQHHERYKRNIELIRARVDELELQHHRLLKVLVAADTDMNEEVIEARSTMRSHLEQERTLLNLTPPDPDPPSNGSTSEIHIREKILCPECGKTFADLIPYVEHACKSKTGTSAHSQISQEIRTFPHGQNFSYHVPMPYYGSPMPPIPIYRTRTSFSNPHSSCYYPEPPNWYESHSFPHCWCHHGQVHQTPSWCPSYPPPPPAHASNPHHHIQYEQDQIFPPPPPPPPQPLPPSNNTEFTFQDLLQFEETLEEIVN